MTDRLWSVEDIAAYTGHGISRAWKLVYTPEFPKPVRIFGDRSHPRWVEREVGEFCEAKREAA